MADPATRGILLGGYVAKHCPVRTHNDWDPTVPAMAWEPATELQARLDAGVAFEREVFDALKALHGPDAREVKVSDEQGRIADTLEAMRDGVLIILGGQLPHDNEGHRVGKPDILVRHSSSGKPSYLPADVKHHGVAAAAKRASTEATVSTLTEPNRRVSVPFYSTTKHRPEDSLQLAHYTRMLQACGFHPGGDELVGGIVSTSQVAVSGSDPDLILVWHALDVPYFTTYSAREGKKNRTALERYDHEFDFRVEVARVAARRTGRLDDPVPLVIPIGQEECFSCPYEHWCAAQTTEDNPSFALQAGRLTVREWQALASLGVTTTSQLADLDPTDTSFLSAYLPLVSHRRTSDASTMLVRAVERSRLIRDGVLLQPKSEELDPLPSADIEVDVDIENDADSRVYMWGVRVREGRDDSTAVYLSDFTSWEQLTDESERELAAAYVSWLRGLIAGAEAEGMSVRVFHWSHPETSRLRRLLGKDEVEDLIARYYVDLRTELEARFITVAGSGLKLIGQAVGYSWSADDAGGGVSQHYIDLARHAPTGSERERARAWLTAYNQDDVRATSVIRDRLPLFAKTASPSSGAS